jgi:hypothetical protein
LNTDKVKSEAFYCDLETLKVNSENYKISLDFTEPLVKKPSSLSLVSGDEKTDKENAKIVFRSLQDLNPSLASDIRIWFTLGVELFNDYTSIRWPFPVDATKGRKFIQDRLISDSGRSIRRDNAIGRLWRIGWAADRCQSLDFDQAIEALLLSQDMAASFLDRVTLTQVQAFADSLLNKIYLEHIKNSTTPYDRTKHREFLKLLDLYAGSHALAVMSSKDMDRLIDEQFAIAYKS